MTRLSAEIAALALIVLSPALSWGACEVQTGTPAYSNGTVLSMPACDATGALKTTATLSSGGDASLAEQQTQTTKLTSIDGKIPAAAAMADDTANPTVSKIASYNMCFDGVTWDRCVKGTAGAGTVDSGTARTAEATDSQLSTDIAAIKTAVQLIDDDQTGASLNHHVSVGTTEDETEIKATAGRLLSIQVTNSAATAAYFRCANLTAANTTPGTSTVFYGLAVPGATTGAGITANFGPMGIAFSTALTCWVVTGKAESDVAEVGANDVQWNVQYK